MVFLNQVQGKADITLLSDGRTRANRRWLEDQIDKSKFQEYSELWIVYRGKPCKGIARGRKIAFGSVAREMLFAKLSFSRTLLTLKERSVFNSSGEMDSHDTTFSGVEFPQKLTLMNTNDKNKMFGRAAEQSTMVPDKYDVSHGTPAFWQESKSAEFWSALLEAWNIKAVVDVTPGSGELAKSCLTLGLPYVGFAMDAVHQAWLEKTCTVHSLRIIATAGSVLHCQDLSQAIESCYHDLLEDDKDDEGNPNDGSSDDGE